eukprot:3614558-Heterocapsa_arctica.AAC.1
MLRPLRLGGGGARACAPPQARRPSCSSWLAVNDLPGSERCASNAATTFSRLNYSALPLIPFTLMP